MKPYYEHAGITIYHGDCRDVLPSVAVTADCVIVTDPPFPDYHTETYQQCDIGFLSEFDCRQFIFWSTRVDFPLDWNARHVWDKRKGGAGSAYEFVYERNGSREQWVWPFVSIQNPTRADFARDEFTGHPSQKPWRLISKILSLTQASLVIDPFLGSGSTLTAAKRIGLKGIGIEVEERYCELAASRLSQGVMQFG